MQIKIEKFFGKFFGILLLVLGTAELILGTRRLIMELSAGPLTDFRVKQFIYVGLVSVIGLFTGWLMLYMIGCFKSKQPVKRTTRKTNFIGTFIASVLIILSFGCSSEPPDEEKIMKSYVSGLGYKSIDVDEDGTYDGFYSGPTEYSSGWLPMYDPRLKDMYDYNLIKSMSLPASPKLFEAYEEYAQATRRFRYLYWKERYEHEQKVKEARQK